jgi:hypothetical protein
MWRNIIMFREMKNRCHCKHADGCRTYFSHLPVVISVITLLCLLLVSAPSYGFSGGTGTPSDPYLIAEANHLELISQDPNLASQHFLLIADIDLDPESAGGRVFERSVLPVFSGTFNGDGHIIRNLIIGGQPRNEAGFFQGITLEGRVRNLGLEKVSVLGYQTAGGMAGFNRGFITNCFVTGTVSARSTVGGIVGENNHGAVVIVD